MTIIVIKPYHQKNEHDPFFIFIIIPLPYPLRLIFYFSLKNQALVTSSFGIISSTSSHRNNPLFNHITIYHNGTLAPDKTT